MDCIALQKRHNYLIVNKTNDTTLHKDLFENALNLINTIQDNIYIYIKPTIINL